MNIDDITSIRILPSDKGTFSKESEFKYFIENTMVERGGDYYFPNLMMNFSRNTLVLFQYDGMIRAVGILVDLDKKKVIDEREVEYAGYYRFDTNTLEYLDNPIDKDTMRIAYPDFNCFSQSKQIIPLDYLGDILDMLKNTNSVTMDNDQDIIDRIEASNLEGDIKEALVKVRINQGIFREKLLKKYNKCCLCGVGNTTLLVASHIKPWAMSNSKEKLDVENGFLLCPNHDSLFDKGLISFDVNGNIIISDSLNQHDRIFMNVKNDMQISITEANKKYLKYHRQNVFRG